MSGINLGNLQADEDVQIGEINIPLITPKKGVDYWTPQDKQEVVTDAVNAVNAVINPQEEQRQANEQIRQNNEGSRQDNETTRQSNETTRQSNETTRQENEATRQANETERQERFAEYETIIEGLESDISDIQGDIGDIQDEQTTQNTSIASNTSAINSLQNTKANRNELPSKLSELNNDTGFITKDVNNLTNYYKKTESYTKGEVDSALSGKQNTIDSSNKLASDFVDDTNQTNKFVTTEEKTKLAGIEAEANKTIVDDELSSSSENPVQNKVINASQEEQNNKIANLEQDVEDLRNNSLQVSDTGTNFKLSNTAKARFIELFMKGNTFQQSYNGYNLQNGVAGFSKFAVTEATYTTDNTCITVSSTATTRYSGLELLSIAITNGKTYTVSMKATYDTDGLPNFRLGKGNNLAGNIIGTGTATLVDNSYYNIVCTFTADSDFTLDIMLYPSYTTNTTTHTAKFYDFQIVEGATEKPFEPYVGGKASPNPDYPQTIHNVSGNNNIKIENKNLLRPDEFIQKTLTTDREGSHSSYNSTTKILNIAMGNNSVLFDNFKPNTQYTLILKYRVTSSVSTNMRFKYSDGTTSNISASTSSSITTETHIKKFLTNSSKSIVAIEHNAYGNSRDLYIYECGIFEGDIEIEDFVAHQEQNLPFTFETGQKAMQGTTLQDNGIHQTRKQIDLGSLSWEYKNTNSTTGISTYMASLSDRKKSSDVVALSSHYKYLGTVAGISIMYSKGLGIAFYYNQTSPNTTSIYLNSTISSEIDLATFLENNNVILEYELETEEVIPYSITQQAQYNAIKQAFSYLDETNISGTSSDLEPVIDATAIRSLNDILTRLEVLESEV